MSTVENVTIDLAVQLGTASMPVHQLLRMGRGAVIALDQLESEDVVLLAHNTPIAKAQVMVQGENIKVTITRMLPLPAERRRTAKPAIPADADAGSQGDMDAPAAAGDPENPANPVESATDGAATPDDRTV
ncbi:FliM/FliN family flagellar motor switch protein [Microbaculum marinisediminis]|uniref:FliM/FliN family flagellar motor switch protein n=1 Tax=Microbaculum marinisediminis TaxID=2931392 RepID=A0AAW5R519_9HYPH|nr:FliM/FliN family flagellar motor switch protein [Microbaculum sp. A6E488]MCT8974470.1 FliM/FliN family flagellar motor switch protein [Microbaculum sp. A6E488]